MLAKSVLLVSLAALSGAALAQHGDGRSDDRWNITGPNWYDTPCSVPIRVCEYKTLTLSYPADPDVPCEQMAKPAGVGELVRTYLKRWD